MKRLDGIFRNNSPFFLGLETFEILLQNLSASGGNLGTVTVYMLFCFLYGLYFDQYFYFLFGSVNAHLYAQIIQYSFPCLELHLYCLTERNSWYPLLFYYFSLLLSCWVIQLLSLSVGNFISFNFKFMRKVLPWPSTIKNNFMFVDCFLI